MIFFFIISTALGISINGDFTVNGIVSCASIDSASIETDGSISIDSSLIATTISTTYASADSLTVSSISSPTGTLTIQGNINLSPASSTSFIENTWKLHESNSFEDSHQNWSSESLNSCGTHYFLGGDCRITEVFKEFKLPPHRFVRVVGILHILDLWQGETIEIKADGKTIWSRRTHSHEKGVDVCGDKHPDPGFGTKFDITVPHFLSEFTLTFQSNIDVEECHASFAIGEVTVFTRI